MAQAQRVPQILTEKDFRVSLALLLTSWAGDSYKLRYPIRYFALGAISPRGGSTGDAEGEIGASSCRAG
ncbi:MAG: hypothetical protein DCE90_13690 [Pseudanabaena sp.]|nr:MAG: hypothetical protein DCE90_13690 [Pseudanabaena sp.]